MATATKFYCFVEDVAEKVHNLGSDTLKVALTNSAPAQSNTVLANITQISGTNGYTTGGTAITVTTSAQTTGTYTLAGNQVVFTASGGAMATFRYPVIYNDTSTSDSLIYFSDYGAGGVTLADGETFTVKFNNANPGTILTIA
jgi:hypothetical protein